MRKPIAACSRADWCSVEPASSDAGRVVAAELRRKCRKGVQEEQYPDWVTRGGITSTYVKKGSKPVQGAGLCRSKSLQECAADRG